MSKYLCADCVCKEQCNGEWTTHCASYVPKEYKQTNEDWIKQCNTEQLAEVFYIVFHNNADRVLNAFWDKHKEVFKKNAMEWLKQPHTEKE